MRLLLLITIILTTFSCTKKETLSLVHWEGYSPLKKRVKFKKYIKEKHNIDLEFNTIHPRNDDDIIETLKKQEADLFIMAPYLLANPNFALYKNEYLGDIDLEKIQNHKLMIPQFLKIPQFKYQGKQKALPIENLTPRLMSKIEIPKEKQSWSLTLSKKYKHLKNFDYIEHIIKQTALASGVDKEKIFDVNHLRDHKSFRVNYKIATSLYSQKWMNYLDTKDMKGSNLVVSFDYFVEENSKENWHYLIPKEGTNFIFETIGITTKTTQNPTKNLIAHEWINFMLSEVYQTEIVIKQHKAKPVIYKFRDKLNETQIKSYSFDRMEFYDNILVPSNVSVSNTIFENFAKEIE
jgi:spermidine/putrescine-binding protein